MASDKTLKSTDQWTITRVETEQGCKIRVGTWIHGNIDPECYVLIVSGRSEFIEKYTCLPERLSLPDSFAFMTWDHRGQGDSSGVKSHIESYDQYANDAAFLVEHFIKKKPYLIVAHSMGGLISLYATCKGLLNPTSMVLCSPLFLLPAQPIPRPIAKLISNTFKKIGAGKLSTGWVIKGEPQFYDNTLTTSYKGFLRSMTSKYVSTPPTMSWVAASFAATELIFSKEALKKISCPALVLAGSDERVVAFDGFSKWIQKARLHIKSKLSFQVIHSARHELLNENIKNKNLAIATIKSWILNTQ